VTLTTPTWGQFVKACKTQHVLPGMEVVLRTVVGPLKTPS